MPPRKKSTKKAVPLPLPAHFIQDSWILSDPPEVLPFLEMAQLGEEVRRIDGEMAVHVMWLREQRDFCTKVGRQHGIRLPTSRNSAFGELDHYTIPLASEEPVDPEGLPESLEEDVSSERDTIKKREEKPTAPVATPRSRPLLRQSQIKPEITSPEAQPPVPASPAKSLHIAAARPPPKVPGRPQLSHNPVFKLQPEKKKDGTSYAFEARIEEATRRKQEQLEKMVEKTRKGNEAKERRVQENLEKIEKKRLEDLQKAEIQQKLAASRSPSRSRLANTATTPTRFKSPARPVLPTPKFISRAKLFDDPPRSVRTPERPHSKQPRMDQLLSAVRSSPAHPSPMRQVARKVPVSTTRKETMKPPKKQAQPSDDALDPQFIENQRRLLMEDEEKTRLREEVRRRLEEEEEEKKKRREEDERRRIEEKERLREEQERLRMEEERRRMEENEQAIGPHSPAQDISMEEDGGSDVDAYEMTQDKIFIPSTAENYHIEDLDSGDETDDECAPRKKVPVWAEWDNLYKTATAQYSKPNVNYDDMFGTMDNPHNQPIFDNSKMTKRRPRGSSAQWNSPASNPTKGKSRFLGY